MCSSTLGPARLPSFVTWPTRKVGMFCPFAANSSCVAASRTWPMLPGADWNFSEKTVWIESTMIKRGTQPRDLFEDALETRFRQQVQRRPFDAEPVAARLDLMLRFLAGAVEHRPDRVREMRRGLQQQRRLADARLAADQHERSGNDAAAQHAIELVDAGRRAAPTRRCRFLRTAAAAPWPPMRTCAAALAAAAPAPAPSAPAAPRRASSTRRTRDSAPATSATARRTPGRRKSSSASLAIADCSRADSPSDESENRRSTDLVSGHRIEHDGHSLTRRCFDRPSAIGNRQS